jgi:hypothetical protein
MAGWRQSGDIMKGPILLAVLGLLSAAAAAAPQASPSGTPCRSDPKGRALDFWVGDWNVVDAKTGEKAGSNRVARQLDGCAITETWHGATAGDDGMSLFTYDARLKSWDQVWVTQDTSRAGGLKRKHMLGVFYGNIVKFQGVIVGPKGRTVVDRTTLVPLTDGRVRQTIEWSRDNGKTFQVVFDAYYNRVGAPDLGNRPGGDPR